MAAKVTDYFSSSKSKRKEKRKLSDADSPVKQTVNSSAFSPKLSKFEKMEFTSPKKSTCKRLRFDSMESNSKLRLPQKYCLLKEKFDSTLVVLSMLEKREELCTFDKLKKAVEEMTRRNFETEDLARMKSISEDVFDFKQEKINKSFELTITSRIKTWTPNKLSEMKNLFHEKLLSLAKEHHKEFLSTLNMPLMLKKIYEWHPLFQLDDVPDIPMSEVPSPPTSDQTGTVSGITRIMKKIDEDRSEAAALKVVLPARKVIPQQLKGVSPALIERIRKKEAVKALSLMTRDPKVQEKINILSRLPEMCRIIRSVYIAEDKVALTWDHMITKLGDSLGSSSLQSDQLETHLKYLVELIPQWLEIITIKTRKYVKIKDKTMSLQALKIIIDQQKRKLTSHS
jgi:chromatin licensing and DNA replication factor 1